MQMRAEQILSSVRSQLYRCDLVCTIAIPRDKRSLAYIERSTPRAVLPIQ
jgi:hypothetical protein